MARRIRLACEALEDRLTPAVKFQFDYRFDSAGFFNDPARRAMLERVGQELGSRIDSHLAALAPSGGNTWSALFFHPATRQTTELPGLAVPADTLVVFVGGSNLSGGEAAQGGMGGYSGGGGADWFNLLGNRGAAFGIWGGSLTFDTDQNWFAGADAAALSASQVDLYTVATHELGHLLGFGTSENFTSLTAGRSFIGLHTQAVNGGVQPTLSADYSHWSQNTSIGGQPASMQPYLLAGQRYGFSELDYAALADIGWTVGGAAAPAEPVVTPPSGTPAAPTQNVDAAHPPIVLTGTSDGIARIVRYINGGLVADRNAIRPFADFNGVLRSVTADVNGDGVTDAVYATGPGGLARFVVVDGATGYVLGSAVTPFDDFSGGLFLGAADFNGDGRDDIVVSADNGGGGRVSVFNFANNVPTRLGDFFGIDDPNFRGGSRVAAADVNGDGTPDLIVGAGFGGGPRVALFDGRTIGQSKPQKLVGDFYAFPGDANALRNGVYVTAGNINADGRADLVFGAGPGGGPVVYAVDSSRILSGDTRGAFAAPLANFFAFAEQERGGVRVGVMDVDRDGRLDLLAGSGSSGQFSWFRSFDAAQVQTYGALSAASSLDGVYVG